MVGAVLHDEAGFQFIYRPGRWEAAICHGFGHNEIPITGNFSMVGTYVMHFSNYIVLGLLIACMIGAAAVVFLQRK